MKHGELLYQRFHLMNIRLSTFNVYSQMISLLPGAVIYCIYKQIKQASTWRFLKTPLHTQFFMGFTGSKIEELFILRRKVRQLLAEHNF